MTRPSFLDHLVFRVADLARTERFYTPLLGHPTYADTDSVMYTIGPTRLFFSAAERIGPPREKDSVGFNHLAFGVRAPEELAAIGTQLDLASIAHSGIVMDAYGEKPFLWFDDPDGLRLEFYLRPESHD